MMDRLAASTSTMVVSPVCGRICVGKSLNATPGPHEQGNTSLHRNEQSVTEPGSHWSSQEVTREAENAVGSQLTY